MPQTTTFDPNAGYQPVGAPPTAPMMQSSQSAPTFDPSAGYQPAPTPAQPSAPLTESDAASGSFANQQAQQKVQDVAGPPTHVLLNGRIQPVNPDTGFIAGVKRNTIGAIAGLHHAFNDPATDSEKADILAKINAENSRAGTQDPTDKNHVPESLALNPSRATLAYHRIIDAPADVLLKKSKDENNAAKELLNNHEWWRGGNMYLSSLADRALTAVPVLGPAINSIAERAESGDVSGAATDVGSMIALEHAPALVKGAGKVAARTGEAVADTARAVPGKIGSIAENIKPESLTKRPETPAPQHGAPLTVESPLDGPTVGSKLAGKDLSQEAVNALQQHVGNTIPVGGSAKNSLVAAVEPVSKTISDTASKMNDVVQKAPAFTTSVMQDNVFGDAKFTDEIDALKKNIPPSVREGLSTDVDEVMQDADHALNSNDPQAVLEYRRQLAKQIDWDSIEKNPATPQEVQNAARAKIYRAIGDKIHNEIPETVELDKTLQPNLELRSHLVKKVGERLVDDPHAATVEAQSELKKGQATVENNLHNEQVAKNWGRIRTALFAAGVSGGVLEGLKHIFGE
jgi:hypothetical protein